jgi:ATP-dependent protease Clp ATPase subunit
MYGKNKKKNKGKKEIIHSIEYIFENVVGMQPVKEVLQSFYNVLQFQNSRKNQGLEYEILKTNFIITGERGSGKTLSAQMLASLLEMFGIDCVTALEDDRTSYDMI